MPVPAEAHQGVYARLRGLWVETDFFVRKCDNARMAGAVSSPANVKPRDSVGHYEGDTLVIDTVGVGSGGAVSL